MRTECLVRVTSEVRVSGDQGLRNSGHGRAQALQHSHVPHAREIPADALLVPVLRMPEDQRGHHLVLPSKYSPLPNGIFRRSWKSSIGPPSPARYDWCMETTHTRRNAGLGIVATWCGYIVFALATDWEDFGLTARSDVHLGWTIARLSTVSFWLFVAAVLLWLRKQPVNWSSFSYAFVATGLTFIVLSNHLVLQGASYWAIAGAVLFYALVSGFLCATVKKPTIAAIAGPALFAVQFLGDVFAHIFSGVSRFQ